jgi:hypothetical protein
MESVITSKNDGRIMINGFQMGIASYICDQDIIIYVSKIEVGIIDKEIKNYKIVDADAALCSDNLKYVFEMFGFSFVVTSKISFINTKYSVDNFISNVTLNCKIFINVTKDDVPLTNLDNINIVIDDDVKFEINYHPNKKVNIVPVFSTFKNGSYKQINKEYSDVINDLFRYKKEQESGKKIMKRKPNVENELKRLRLLKIKYKGFITRNGVDVQLNGTILDK